MLSSNSISINRKPKDYGMNLIPPAPPERKKGFSSEKPKTAGGSFHGQVALGTGQGGRTCPLQRNTVLVQLAHSGLGVRGLR